MSYYSQNARPLSIRTTKFPHFKKEIWKVLASWSDWFLGSPVNTYINISSSSISINQNTQVLFCLFLGIISSITQSSGISLLVEEFSFIDCYRDGDGGVVYFFDGSNCVLNKICACQCNSSSSYSGQFSYVRVQSGIQYKNFAHFVSICQCAQYGNSNRFSSIFFHNGNISLGNVNSSANRCNQYSGFCIQYPSSSYTKLSTLSNNTDDSCRCVLFYVSSHIMSECNIIRNHQVSTSDGTLLNGGPASTQLFNCIIDLNTGATNIIYAWSGSSFTLQNCYLQTNMQKFGNINTQFPLSDSHSLILSNLHSQMCLTLIENDISDVNRLTPNIIINYSINLLGINLLLIHLLTISQ